MVISRVPWKISEYYPFPEMGSPPSFTLFSMAIELQLLLPHHVTPGLHHCDMKLQQEKGYLVPVFPFSPLLVMPSNAKKNPASSPRHTLAEHHRVDKNGQFSPWKV